MKDINSVSPKRRIAYIDLAETIATLLAVVYHSSFCSYYVLQEPGIETLLNYYFRGFLTCGVCMFLTVHGFLMFQKPLDLKRHLLKTLRYAGIALFWGVVAQLVTNQIVGAPFQLKAFLKGMFTWRDGTIHLWYMGALVIIYLAFPVLKYLFDHNRKLFHYVVAVLAIMSFGNKAIAICATFAAGVLGKYHHWVIYENWFSMFNPVPGIPAFTLVYFCLGAYLQDIIEWTKKLRRRNLLVALVTLGAAAVHTVCFLLLWKILGRFHCPVWNGFETLTGLLMTFGILILCSNYQGKIGWKLFRLISVNSLGIYLLHLGRVPCLALREFGMKDVIPALYNLPGNIMIAATIMLVCLGLTMLLRRIPGVKKLIS